MSNVSNTHNVAKLEKNSKALSGQRMARVIAKKNKEGNYESQNLVESKFVSIPILAEINEAQLKAMQPHIFNVLMDAQDQLIREAIIDGATSVHENQFSIDACIKYLDDAAKGNRITGEFIAKWFTETYLEQAMQFACVISKFDPDSLTHEQAAVIEKKCNVLRDMFTGFASGKYKPAIPVCKAITKFAEFVGVDGLDARMGNYVEKAKESQKKQEEEMSMDALGFDS